MSYPIDLDEYTEQALRNEVARRERARIDGRCDYCGQHPSAASCKFPDRHFATVTRHKATPISEEGL